MRVLHVGKFYPPFRGGMEVFLSDLLQEQRRQGIDAHALVHGNPEPADPPWIRRVPVQFKIVYAPIALGFLHALSCALEQLKPDVVHLHMPNNSALWLLALPRARKIPWVVHWHSDVVSSKIQWSVAAAYALYRPFEQALLQHAQKIFVTSPPYMDASPALSRWTHKCSIVPLGIDLNNFPSTQALAPGHHGRPNTKFRLLSIGRLTYYKGFETLIRAVASMPEVELLIAGEGELRQSLQSLIDQMTPHGQLPNTQLLGSVSDEEKYRLLASCDVFCLASRERTEAFGVVLLEAMQSARPCLVSNLPGSGMPWVVAQANCGLHVALDDVEDWRSKIKRLQHDHALRTRLGLAGRNSLHHNFGIDACERAIARHYCDVLGHGAI